MAIAQMKRLTIVSEPHLIQPLLFNLQEVKKSEVSAWTELAEDAKNVLQKHSQTIDQRIQDEMTLRDLRNAISFLQEYVPKRNWRQNFEQRPVYSLKQLERTVKESNVPTIVQEINQTRNEIDRLKKEIQSIDDESDFLRQWQRLRMIPADIENLHHFSIHYGSIPSESKATFLESLDQGQINFYLDELFSNKDTTGYAIVIESEDKQNFNNIIRSQSWTHLDYPYSLPPQEQLQQHLSQRKKAVEQDKKLRQSLKSKTEELSTLLLAEEDLANRIERYKVNELLLESQHLMVLRAWVEQSELQHVLDSLSTTFDSTEYAIRIEDALPEEIRANEVPTKLTNNALNRPFESLTLQYGVPTYDSVDPTPYYSLFQILFFGLMSADLGYGLLMFIATWIGGRMTSLSASTKTSLKMFNYMSIGTMIIGLFFGSFFGFDLPFRVMSLSDNVIEIMVFSVAIGLIHMLVGYALKAKLTYQEKDYGSMYLDSLQWMMMIIGAILLAVNAAWPHPLLRLSGLILLIGNIVGMFIANIIITPNKFVGFGKGLFGMISVAGLVGDVVSYTRLTALAVAGANIGMAFNLIVNLLPPFARFTVGILLFIVLHALNIFITLLGAYVHSMRLQFVEFFGKFFELGGKLFTPLKPVEKHITIQKKNH